MVESQQSISIIVQTFEENSIFLLIVVFLISQFSPIEIQVFVKNFLYPIEDIDFFIPH